MWPNPFPIGPHTSITSYHIRSHHMESNGIALYRIIWQHNILHNIISQSNRSYHSISHHFTSHNIAVCGPIRSPLDHTLASRHIISDRIIVRVRDRVRVSYLLWFRVLSVPTFLFYPYISTGYTPDNPKPYGVTNFEIGFFFILQNHFEKNALVPHICVI